MYARYNGYLIPAHNRHPTRKHNSTNSERYRTTSLASGEKEAPLTRSNRSPNWLLTRSKKNQSKEYCLVCTLDVKNAFNLANWNLVLQPLHRIGISNYLTDLVADYFKDRMLTYSSDVGDHEYQVTEGVPQGCWSILKDQSTAEGS